MVTEIPIRFIKAWRLYRVGDVIRPVGALRQWLIQAGFCERVEEQADTVEKAVAPKRENAAKRNKR